MRRVVVVGGGIAGLATAHRIAQRFPDAKLTVLEASERPGGVLGTRHEDGYLWETAANGFLDSAEDGAVGLCDELGVTLVSADPASKRRWIWRGDRLHEVPTGPGAILKTRLVSFGGKARVFKEPMAEAAPDREETIAEFGRRRLGEEAARAVLEPMTIGVWAGDYEKLSLRAAFPRIAELEATHGSLLGAARAMAKSGRQVTTRTPAAGVEALVAALARELGDALRTGARVTGWSRAGGVHRLTLASGEVLEGDDVVSALPAHALAPLVEAADPELATLLQTIRYVRVMVVVVAVERSHVRHPLDGFGFLVCRDEKPRCLGCLIESTTFAGRAPDGHALLRLMYGGARDSDVVDLDDEAVARQVTADLELTLGAGAPRVLDIVRWERAIPQYAVGHEDLVRHVAGRARELGLAVTGSAFHGAAVNDCVAAARRTAAAL